MPCLGCKKGEKGEEKKREDGKRKEKRREGNIEYYVLVGVFSNE